MEWQWTGHLQSSVRAWSPSNVKLTMWRQLLFELKHFCCVVKTMNNSLYTPYVGVGSRAAGRSTIRRLRSKARQSLKWTRTSIGGGRRERRGMFVCARKRASPCTIRQKTKTKTNEMRVCVFVWVKEWGCLHVTSERVCVHLRRWHLCEVAHRCFQRTLTVW